MFRKILYTTGLIAACIGNMQAQNISIAPEVGLSVSSWSLNNVHTQTAGTGVNGSLGVNLYTPLYKRFKIGTGLFYNSLNSSYQSTADKISGSLNSFSMYYLRLPVNVVYQKPSSKGLLLFNGGVWANYNLGGEITVYKRNRPLTGEEVLGVHTTNTVFGRSTNETNPLGLGVNAGISYRFPVGIFLNLQYNVALTKVTVKDYGTHRQQYASLGVGYLLHTGKKR